MTISPLLSTNLKLFYKEKKIIYPRFLSENLSFSSHWLISLSFQIIVLNLSDHIQYFMGVLTLTKGVRHTIGSYLMFHRHSSVSGPPVSKHTMPFSLLLIFPLMFSNFETEITTSHWMHNLSFHTTEIVTLLQYLSLLIQLAYFWKKRPCHCLKAERLKSDFKIHVS